MLILYDARQMLAVLGALLALGLGRPAPAATYYVGPQGDDRHTGASPGAAFRTFARATQQLGPGDTLLALPGAYAGFSLNVSGTPRAPITISGYDDPGQLPKIVGDQADPAIFIQANYVRLTKLNVTTGQSSVAAGIQAYGSHHVTVDHVVAHDSGGGGLMSTFCDYVEFSQNLVFRNAYSAPNETSGISVGLGVNSDRLPGVHNVISGNISYDNIDLVPLTGRTHTTDGNGIIIDRLDYNGVPFVGVTQVFNNLVFRNGGAGIAVFDSSNVEVTNNTSAGNQQDSNLAGLRAEIESEYGTANRFLNNIAVAVRSNAYAMLDANGASNSFDYNLLTGGTPARRISIASVTNWGTHNRYGGDPAFQGPNNFMVQPGSPVLNAGAAKLAPRADIRGVPRPQIGSVDLGAYQQSK